MASRNLPTKRQAMLTLTAILAAAGGAYAGFAGATGGIPEPQFAGDSAVEAQAFQFTDTPATTASTDFVDVPGLSDIGLCAPQDGVSATVSLQLAGGPGQVRVTMRRRGKDVPLYPRAARFDPAGSTGTSFSFTFVRQIRPHLPGSFDVEWRATTATPIDVQRGSVRILYGVEDGVGCA